MTCCLNDKIFTMFVRLLPVFALLSLTGAAKVYYLSSLSSQQDLRPAVSRKLDGKVDRAMRADAGLTSEVNSGITFKVRRTFESTNAIHTRMDEYFAVRGVHYRVYGAQIITHERDDGNTISGRFIDDLGPDLAGINPADFSPQDKMQELMAQERRASKSQGNAELIVYVPENTSKAVYAHHINYVVQGRGRAGKQLTRDINGGFAGGRGFAPVDPNDPNLPKRPYYIIDAVTGEIYRQWDGMAY